jgi:hypothetical protein
MIAKHLYNPTKTNKIQQEFDLGFTNKVCQILKELIACIC